MEFSTVPSSAEVNDVITAVLDGTDCIYLDVTMRSAHAVHCIQYASSLCRQGEAAVWEQQLFSELNYKVRERGPRGTSFGGNRTSNDNNTLLSQKRNGIAARKQGRIG